VRADVQGCRTSFELALRFIDWANRLGGTPTRAQIQERYGVSRATAYRWKSAWDTVKEMQA
jgi:transposase